MIDRITHEPITISDVRAELAMVERQLTEVERHGGPLVWQLTLMKRIRILTAIAAYPTEVKTR